MRQILHKDKCKRYPASGTNCLRLIQVFINDTQTGRFHHLNEADVIQYGQVHCYLGGQGLEDVADAVVKNLLYKSLVPGEH